MAKKLYKKTGNNTYEIQGILPTETEWGKVVLTDDLTQATSTKLGLVKSSMTGTAANRDYNVQVNSDGTMKVNVPWTDTNTDTNTSHSHSAGVGLVGSGSAGTSGTYTYKAKLRSETALTVNSAAATTSGNVYPVAVDKSGYLSLNVPLAGFEDILKGIKGRTQVEWNALNAGEYGSNSTYNGATLPPVLLENNSGFWNSASGRPLDISFHFTKKERITTLQVKCPPYSGINPTMTVYYAQKGDSGLTLYKKIATISTADSKAYEFNEEGISADYWVVRFTSSGWIDLKLCSPSGLFTTGLYTEECHQQIMDRFNGYQPVGSYQPKGDYVTIGTAQTITGRKTFNSPANVNDKEVATAIFKTSNGGQLIIGKEGPNSGTMLRFDQTAGTTRLQFRASATPGAMVWAQPEKGATLYFDLTNSDGVSTRTTLDARSGAIARTSDIKNKKITIQKNGTEVGSFTTNPSSGKTINISLSKNDVGLGNVDNTADKDKNVKHASSADDSTNAFNLVSSDKHTKYTAQDFLQIYTDLDTKIPTEFHDLSYGIFFRNSEGSQYTGADVGNFPERRMIATFDNTTNPHDSDPNIGSKMVDLGTVMSAGVDSDDPQNFGGAIFANFIGPNNSVGEYSDILLQASQVASDKFRETHGASLDGGFGCLDGIARGSLFTSRIDSGTGDIYTSALMFKPNVNSNDQDFQGNMALEMRMPCFSIYNGIQVTTSGSIYDRNDAISPLRDMNEHGVAFLAYSKTGQNVDIDSITEDYQPKGSYVTTNTEQTISAKKTFSTTPVLSALKNKKVLGTDSNGLIQAHTLGIDDITDLRSQLNGKANVGHGHTISAITNLQTTLDGKQNKIEYPCSFNDSSGNYVRLMRAGTNSYYAEIEHGSVTYNGSTTQYPEIKVTFPHKFNYKPTVIVSFAPTSNSTGTYEALKVIDVTSTGFTVITRMSASISGGYFRVNWIAIYTV